MTEDKNKDVEFDDDFFSDTDDLDGSEVIVEDSDGNSVEDNSDSSSTEESADYDQFCWPKYYGQEPATNEFFCEKKKSKENLISFGVVIACLAIAAFWAWIFFRNV